MPTAANQDFKTGTALDELNHIVEQAEALLRSLGEDGGEAAAAVRQRVTETLNDAKAKLAAAAEQAEEVVETFAERADGYVRQNPWQALALAALLGGVAAYLIAKARRG